MLAATAALLACGSPGPRRWFTGACAGEGPCDGSGLCVDGSCARSCATSADCGDGVCIQAHCLPPALVCARGLCADASTCTTDLCNVHTGECRHELFPGACDDGDLCTIGDECVGATGAVVCKGAPKCDDGDPATVDSCAPATGICSTLGM